MKTFMILLAGSASLLAAACSAPAPTKQETKSVEAPAEVAPIATVGDAPTGPIYTEAAGDTLALSGFDAVSYFTGDGTPMEGSKDNKVIYQGYEYRFATPENAREFAADPAKYAPQYGGNCAWAASNGKLAPGNPKNYKVVDGKLYLNFNDAVQETWLKDIPGYIKKADVEYPKFTPDQRYDDADS